MGMSLGQEMARKIKLPIAILLLIAIPNFDAFSLSKRHSPVFNPKPFFSFNYNHNDWEQNESLGHQSNTKKNGPIGVEVRGPIVRPIDFKKPLSAVLKRSAPKLKFFGGFYNPNHDYTDVYEQNRDERYQNEARMPDSIEVELRDPIVRPISFKKPLDVMTMQKKQSPFFSP